MRTKTPKDARDLFGAAVYAYTRADAFHDGYLIDVTRAARPAGFRLPVALTRAAWESCVTWDVTDDRRKGVHQDQRARLLDVLTLAMFRVKAATRRHADTDRATFGVVRIPRDGRGTQADELTLELVIGPDDDGAPCVTIGLPEDFW